MKNISVLLTICYLTHFVILPLFRLYFWRILY